MGNSVETLSGVNEGASEISDSSSNIGDNVAKAILFVGALEKTRQVIKTVYDNSIGSMNDLNTAFSVGLVEGLFANNIDSNFKPTIDSARIEFTNYQKVFLPIYNSARQKLERAVSDNIAGEMLRMPEEHLLKKRGPVEIGTNILKAAERVALQRAKIHPSEKLADVSIEIKAYAIAFSGYLNASVFQLGKSTGSAIRKNIISTLKDRYDIEGEINPKTQAAIDATLRQGLALYVWGMGEATKIPFELVNLTFGSIICLMTGAASALQSKTGTLSFNRNLLRDVKGTMDYAYNNPWESLMLTGNLAMDVGTSICADFYISYTEQQKKQNASDSKLVQDNGVEQVLQDTPWKKAQDLAIQKEFIDSAIGREINPYLNIFRASVVAAKATALSSAFKLGRVAASVFIQENQFHGLSR